MYNKTLILLLLVGLGLVIVLVRFYVLSQKRKSDMERLGAEVAVLKQLNAGLTDENLRLKGYRS